MLSGFIGNGLILALPNFSGPGALTINIDYGTPGASTGAFWNALSTFLAGSSIIFNVPSTQNNASQTNYSTSSANFLPGDGWTHRWIAQATWFKSPSFFWQLELFTQVSTSTTWRQATGTSPVGATKDVTILGLMNDPNVGPRGEKASVTYPQLYNPTAMGFAASVPQGGVTAIT